MPLYEYSIFYKYRKEVNSMYYLLSIYLRLPSYEYTYFTVEGMG